MNSAQPFAVSRVFVVVGVATRGKVKLCLDFISYILRYISKCLVGK